MKVQLKYWQLLLTQWRREGGDGLTLPFIIGAQKYFHVTPPEQTIAELVMDIAQSNEFEVYLTYCMDIKELILGIREGRKCDIAGTHLKLENGENSSLFLTKFVDDLGTDLKSLQESLIEKFQDTIDARQYSINQKEWGDYTSSEVKFILTCYAA